MRRKARGRQAPTFATAQVHGWIERHIRREDAERVAPSPSTPPTVSQNVLPGTNLPPTHKQHATADTSWAGYKLTSVRQVVANQPRGITTITAHLSYAPHLRGCARLGCWSIRDVIRENGTFLWYVEKNKNKIHPRTAQPINPRAPSVQIPSAVQARRSPIAVSLQQNTYAPTARQSC